MGKQFRAGALTLKETTLGRSTTSYGAETIALMYVGSMSSFPVGGTLHISAEIFRKIIYLYNLITRSISKGSPPSTLEWLGGWVATLWVC